MSDPGQSGTQIDVMGQQRRRSLFHQPSRIRFDRARKAMVDKNGVGLRLDGRLNQGRGGNAWLILRTSGRPST
jgi:hypothetical protein